MQIISNWNPRALGYQQITAGGVDTATLLTVPAGASIAVIKPFAQAVRFRDDGTNPTASVGYPLAVGTEYIYSGASLGVVKFIAQAAGAGLDVLYYG